MSTHPAPPESTQTIVLSKGVTLSVVRGSDATDFDASLGDEVIDRLCHMGDIPAELRTAVSEWARLTAIEIAVLLFDRADEAGSWFTRKQLRTALVALRRRLKRGGAMAVEPWLQEELYAILGAKMKCERLGTPLWRPTHDAPVDVLNQILDERDRRVDAALGDRAALIALIEEVIDALKGAPERTREWFAREGQIKPISRAVAENAMRFWTDKLGRPEGISDGLVAFAELALSIFGVPRKEVRAVRALLESAHARTRARSCRPRFRHD